jgi:hypothetical protein
VKLYVSQNDTLFPAKSFYMSKNDQIPFPKKIKISVESLKSQKKTGICPEKGIKLKKIYLAQNLQHSKYNRK